MKSNQSTASCAGRRHHKMGAVPWIFIVAATSNGAVHAGLSFTVVSTPLPLVSIPRDAAIGYEWPSGLMSTFTARGDNTGGCDSVEISISNIRGGQELAPGSAIYRTGVDGIGVRYKVSFDGRPEEFATLNKTYGPFNLTGRDSPNPNSKVFEVRTLLIVTGLPVGSGQLIIPSADVRANPRGGETGGSVPGCPGLTNGYAWTPRAQNMVSARTCSVGNSSVDQTVSMREVRASDFPSVGDIQGAATFDVDLQCDAGVLVGMTFSNPDALGGTVLPTTGSASGLGIQIIPETTGVPVSFGADSAVAGNPGQFLAVPERTTAAGLQRIRFGARYIRTGTVLPGSVVARATYTLSYQ